jgi:cytochrome bd ubiquinol oxidase subunit I
MQHPVGFAMNNDGAFGLTSLPALLTNPWAIWQYFHNMIAAVVTGSVVMAALGAFYLLVHRFEEFGRTFVGLGVIAGLIASLLIIFPTGDERDKTSRAINRSHWRRWKVFFKPSAVRRS